MRRAFLVTGGAMLLLVFLLSLHSAFAALPVIMGDQGSDVRSISTGELLPLGNLTVSIYDDPTAGSLIFENNFTDVIINGSWNVMLYNVSMDYGKTYYKDYVINGDDLDFNGQERLAFTSSLGEINITSNITLGEKILFALGAFIRNTVPGWLGIESNVNITNDLEVGGNVNVVGNITINGVNVCLSNGIDCVANVSGGGNTTYIYNNFTYNITNNVTYYVNTTNNITYNYSNNYYTNITNNVTNNNTYYVNNTYNFTYNITNNFTQNFTYYVNNTYNITNNLTYNITNNVTYYVNTTNNITNNVTQNITYNITNNLTYNYTYNITNNLTNNYTYNYTYNITNNFSSGIFTVQSMNLSYITVRNGTVSNISVNLSGFDSRYLLLTDSRFNDSARIDSLNSSKLQNGSYVNLSSLFVVNNVTALNFFGNINYSYILNVPSFLLSSDQRFNETSRINSVNSTSNVQSLGFNTTTQLDSRYSFKGEYVNLTNNLTQNITYNVTQNITYNYTYNITNNITQNITYYVNNTYNITYNVTNNLTNNYTYNITYNITNNITYNITNNFTQNITYNVTNNITYYNNITQNITYNYTYNITNNLTYNITNNVTNNITQNITYYVNNTYNITYNITNNFTNNITYNVTNNFTNNYTYNYTYNITNNITYNITNNLTQNITYNVTQNITYNYTYNITNNITNNFSSGIVTIQSMNLSYLNVANGSISNISINLSGFDSRYLLLTDSRFNESARIDSLNSTKLQNGSVANLSSVFVVNNLTALNIFASLNWSYLLNVPSFVLSSNLVSLVGNWSADKSNYNTTTQLDSRYSFKGEYVNLTNNITYNVTNNITQNITYNYTYNITNNITNNITQNITYNYTYNITNNITQNITYNYTYNITNNITQNITYNITNNITVSLNYSEHFDQFLNTTSTPTFLNLTVTGNMTTTSINATSTSYIAGLIICNNGTATIMTRNTTLASSYGCVI